MIYWLLACAILLALAMAISGWWYARNWWLYSDPFLGNMLEHHFSEHPELSTFGDWIAPYRQAEVSYWAVFGWLNITVPEIFHRVFSLFSRIGLIGLLSFIIRWLLRRPLSVRVEAVGWLLLWITLILAGLANYVRVFGGLQGRHYFPAICSVSILLVLGWISLLPSRFWTLFCGGLAVIMPMLSVALPARFMLTLCAAASHHNGANSPDSATASALLW